MGISAADDVVQRVDDLASSYYRLVLVVGPTRSGKTGVLQEAGRRLSAPVVNINLKLSERLIDLSPRQRALRAGEIVEAIVQPSASAATLLDNIEVLFDPQLQQDPLKLLQMLSRRGTLIVAWPGVMDGDNLVYAEPGHPEYRRYPRPDAVIVQLEQEN